MAKKTITATNDYFKKNGSPTLEPDHPTTTNTNNTTDYFKDVVHSPDAVYDYPQKTTSTGNGVTNPNGTGSGGGSGTGGGSGSGGSSSGRINGVSSDVYNLLNGTFAPSQSYLDAINYTNELLQKLSSGRTSYTDQINALMDQIMNRDKFSYDMSKDTLFQEYLSEMMGSGQTAMRDTIGQASALSGGYGSSYATVAGNQTYNSYIQDAYSNLPEYYNLALSAYNAEGETMYNNLAMLNQADSTEYNRLLEAYNANYNSANNLYNQEYQNWSDQINNAFNVAKMQNSDYWNSAELGYKYSSLAQSQKQWEAEMAYQKEKDKATATANAKNSILEHNAEVAKQKQADQDALDKKYNNDTYINNMVEKGKQIYDAYGEDALREWSESSNGIPQDVPESVYERIMDGITNNYDSKYGKPMEERTFIKVGDDQYQDEYGNVYSYAKLPVKYQTKKTQNSKKGDYLKAK